MYKEDLALNDLHSFQHNLHYNIITYILSWYAIKPNQTKPNQTFIYIAFPNLLNTSLFIMHFLSKY